MKNANKQKIIALSLCVLSSVPVWAGLGSLQVNSALGEPFSASVVVSGDEAKAALKNRPVVAGANLQVQVTPRGQNAVIHLHSNQPVHDPMLSFSLTAGNQGRQYTAMLDPRSYAQRRVAKNAPKSKHHEPTKHPRERSGARATAALSNALASDNAVVQYRVDKNETLIDVARKVQPQGLTLEQTMHALVVANPQAFRGGNPDVMYRDVRLNIPSTAQLRRLSKLKNKAIAKAEDAAPVVPTPKEKVAEQVPAKDNNGVAAPSNQLPVSAPDAAKTATEVVAASAPAAMTASMASSVPVASAASAVAASVPKVADTPKIQHTSPSPAPVQSETEESDLMEWLPYALAGTAGVLLIAAILWMRRKKQVTEYDNESLEDFDDEDDVVFATNDISEEKPSFGLDAQNKQETAPKNAASAAASAESDDDWSWLANNEATTQDTSVKQDVSSISEKNTGSSTVKSDSAVAGKHATSAGDDWMNFKFDDAPAKSAAPATGSNDEDLSWLTQFNNTGENKVQAGKQAQTQDALHEESSDGADLEWVVADSEYDQTSPEADVLPTVDLAENSVEHVLSDSLVTEKLSDYTDDAPQTIGGIPASDDQHAFTPESSTTAGIDWDSINLDDGGESLVVTSASDGKVAAESVSEGVTAASETSSMDFALVDDEPVGTASESAVAASSTPISSFATGVGIQDWEREAPQPKSDEPLSPEQQAVPLQAKLELAKMYLEMDDAVTARQTLRELIEEANGTILAEAQNLLHQLGG